MRKVLSDNKINAFFVVDETDKPMYTGLTEMIGTQAATETMDTKGAGSIVNRITTFYQVNACNLCLFIVSTSCLHEQCLLGRLTVLDFVG